MDVTGHIGMALLWTAFAWFAWENERALTFVGVGVAAGLFPDVDLYLRRVLAVHHHGVVHTVLAVVIVAVVGGAVGASLLRSAGDNRWRRRTWSALFSFVAAAILVGGLSHLFADMLSAPDIAQPIEPFWPFFDKPVSFDVVYYTANVWNYGLLVVGLVVHAVLSQFDGLPLGDRGADVGPSEGK